MNINISEEEDQYVCFGHIERLVSVLTTTIRQKNRRQRAYFEGKQEVNMLGISSPDYIIRKLATSIDWGSTYLKRLVEKTNVRGYNIPGISTDVPLLSRASSAAQMNAFVCGIGFLSIDFGNTELDEPKVIVASEDPDLIYGDINKFNQKYVRAIKITDENDEGYYGHYFVHGLGVRDFYLGNDGSRLITEWKDTSLSQNRVPIVPIVNSGYLDNPGKLGRSELTPAIRSYIDGAIRSLVRTEVNDEFNSFPKLVFYTDDEDNFEGRYGDKSNYAVAADRANLMGKDDRVDVLNGSGSREIISSVETYAKLFSSATGLPNHWLSVVTTANPTSAEAMLISSQQFDSVAKAKIDFFEASYRILGEYIIDLINPEDQENISATPIFTDYSRLELSTRIEDVAKLIELGIVSANSNIALSKLGFTPEETESIQAEGLRTSSSKILDIIRDSASGAGVEGE